MKTSPFKYGVTVSEGAFTNREQEIEKLYNNLTQGINTTIISPRRWGKSSLVEKVVKNIRKKEKSIKIVVLDLFATSSEEEFLERFTREVIKASDNKWQEWMKSGTSFFKHLVPKFSVGIDPVNDFSVSFDWEEIKRHKDEILDLPEKIANKKNLSFIICLDEFQNLASFNDYESLEKKMRSIWQRQKKVTYCIYGSKRHMMTDIFNNPSKPFYRFGDVLSLPKISREKWVKFIKSSFKKSGKNIDADAARLIPESMKDHSWYVQQLAYFTWQNTDVQADTDLVKNALTALLQTNTPLFQKEIEILSTTQVNLLKAIGSGETKLTSTKVMQKYRLGTPRNVSKNRETLIKSDVIYKDGKNLEFIDPAFEKWFLMEYLDRPLF